METKMMRPNREEVKDILTALLVTRKEATQGGVPLTQLDQDFREQEGTRIPFRQLGFPSLVDFVLSLSSNLRVVSKNGQYYVSPIISNQIEHISKFVAGQNSKRIPRVGRKPFKTSSYYPRVPHRFVPVSNDILAEIVGWVKKSPNGVHLKDALAHASARLCYININSGNFERQIRDLNHEIIMDSSILYSVSNYQKRFLNNTPKDQRASIDNRPAGLSDSDHEECFDFVTNRSNDNQINEKNTNKDSIEIFNDVAVTHSTDEKAKSKENYKNLDKENDQNIDKENDQNLDKKNNNGTNDKENAAILINERTRFRLQKLIESHPEGIWCAELPTLYQKEYSIPLNYEELGFGSVSVYASYLPDIFRCVRPQVNGDFKLFNAKAPQPDIKHSERPKILTLASIHNIYEQYVEPVEAVPMSLKGKLAEKLIPPEVMTAGESVGHICVTQFRCGENEFLNVVVCDVFTPSLFWIQLLNRIQKFNEFMTTLHSFYEVHEKSYVMPAAVMEVGINCACLYDNKWHRAQIKKIRADNTVTLFFYDYGTVEDYPKNKVHFLHRSFSNLPAQAIACGLINIKPVTGNRWSYDISVEFVLKAMHVPLVATIASIDTDNNTMMVALTNTEGDEDFYINDWMVQAGFAVYGKMVCMRNPSIAFQQFLKRECSNSSESKKETHSSYILNNINSQQKVSSGIILDESYSTDESYRTGFYEALLKHHRRLSKISKELVTSEEVKRKKSLTHLSPIPELDQSLDYEDAGASHNAHLNEPPPLLFARNKEDDSDLTEFGSFHSKLGGNENLEDIDWTEIRKIINSPNETSVTRNDVELKKKNFYERQKIEKFVEHAEKPVNNKDIPLTNSSSRVLNARKILFDFIRTHKRGSTDIQLNEKREMTETYTGEKKRIDQFKDCEKKFDERNEIQKPVESLETKVPIDEPVKKMTAKILPNLPRGDERFLKYVNDVILSDPSQSKYLPERNIKMKTYVTATAMKIMKKLKQPRPAEIKLEIPDCFLETIKSTEDRLVTPESSNLIHSFTESRDISSTETNCLAEISFDSLDQSSKSKDINEISENEDPIKSSTPLEKSSTIDEDAMRKMDSSCIREEKNSWLHNVCPKRTREFYSKIMKSFLRVQNASELDSDDFSEDEHIKPEISVVKTTIRKEDSQQSIEKQCKDKEASADILEEKNQIDKNENKFVDSNEKENILDSPSLKSTEKYKDKEDSVHVEEMNGDEFIDSKEKENALYSSSLESTEKEYKDKEDSVHLEEMNGNEFVDSNEKEYKDKKGRVHFEETNGIEFVDSKEKENAFDSSSLKCSKKQYKDEEGLPLLFEENNGIDNNENKLVVVNGKENISDSPSLTRCKISPESTSHEELSLEKLKNTSERKYVVFDDLEIESDTDTWDFSPGWDVSNIVESLQKQQGQQITEIDDEDILRAKNEIKEISKNMSEVESSLEISSNPEDEMSCAASMQDTDTETEFSDNEYSLIHDVLKCSETQPLINSEEIFDSNEEYCHWDSSESSPIKNISIMNEIKKLNIMNTSNIVDDPELDSSSESSSN